MKNIIFMQDIDTNRKTDSADNVVSNPQIHGRKWPGDISPYEYSIESWKRWASKNNSEVIVMEDLLCPTKQMGIAWQRHHVMDMLENENIEYDQILIVDADTIVHPECPNFFELSA